MRIVLEIPCKGEELDSWLAGTCSGLPHMLYALVEADHPKRQNYQVFLPM